MGNSTAPFNRCIGLVVLEVVMSNPNGDPDMDSDPRTFDDTGKGLITPVSFKRKLRDLMEDNSVVFEAADKALNLMKQPSHQFGVLERRGPKREEIAALNSEQFKDRYWDARVFGNTFLESLKDETLSDEQKIKKKEGGYAHLIRTGAVQVGVGTSVAPIEIERLTMTNKAGVQDDKDRGMAPLGFRVVRYGVYTIPFYVNPSIAAKTGMDQKDLELLKFLVPHAYQQTASAVRPQISILHAWFAEHNNPLGSCPDHRLVDALTPTVKPEVDSPSSRSDYSIPRLSDVESETVERFKSVVDLMDS